MMKWTPIIEGYSYPVDPPAQNRKQRFGRLLVARYVAVNVIGLLFLAIAWRQGLVAQAWEADASRLTLVMLVAFVWVLVVGGWRAWKISSELDRF